MEPDPIRFGILGCATIARKISRAILLSPNAVITAVSSRSLTKAQLFISSNNLPNSVKAHGSYESLLDDTCVDAVYIPLPASLHVTWAVAAAEKGKHVLLEKPAAVNGSDLERILGACGSNNVQFMDGTMFLHHPRMGRIKEALDSEVFGPVKIINCTSTFSAPPDFFTTNIRTNPSLEPLGALGDLGWYCIGVILWSLDHQLPSTVTALPSLALTPSNIILSCAASLHWTHLNTIATFHCSFLSDVSMYLTVVGTNGSIQVKDLAIPFRESLASFDLNFGANMWSRKQEEVVVETDAPQEVSMVKEFARLARCVRDSGCGPEMKWFEFSRKTQVVLDAVMRSIELGFKPIVL